MKRYKIKMKLLSPVHIGTGQDFEPLNYVMDTFVSSKTNTTFYLMYVFDEYNFFANLNEKDKEIFLKYASEINDNGVRMLHRFIYERKDLAKKSKKYLVEVNKRIFDFYQSRIGAIMQTSSSGSMVYNALEIAKTFVNANSHKAIIPGSSIKGSISTACQKSLFTIETNSTSHPFKDFIVNDSNESASTKIEKIINRYRKKVTTNEPVNALEMLNSFSNNNLEQKKRSELSIIAQIISKGAEFKTEFKVKDSCPSIQEIAKACNNHYLPLIKDLKNDDNLDIKSDFFNKTLAPNEFLLKIGKYSGKRAVSIKCDKEEKTTWIVESNNLPLGWVLCEYEEIKD